MIAGTRAQACEHGKCRPITILTGPQRAADGSWEVLVEFDERPRWPTPLKVCYVKLDAQAPVDQVNDDTALLDWLEANPEALRRIARWWPTHDTIRYAIRAAKGANHGRFD